MKYLLTMNGTWVKKDDSTKDFEEKKSIEADSIAELKEKFQYILTDEAFKHGYKSVSGVITSIKKLDWTTVAQHKSYMGSFVNTENIQVDLNT